MHDDTAPTPEPPALYGLLIATESAETLRPATEEELFSDDEIVVDGQACHVERF